MIGKADAKKTDIDKIAAFAEALSTYRSKNFTDAKQKFEALVGDKPSEIFAKRCEEFVNNPPEEGWLAPGQVQPWQANSRRR